MKQERGVCNLWEIMQKVKIITFAVMLRDLQVLRDECMILLSDKSSIGFSAPSARSFLESGLVDKAIRFFETANQNCQLIGLDGASQKIGLTLSHLKRSKGRIDASALDSDLRNAEEVIMSECWNMKFIRISSNLSGYVDNDSLFGEEVKIAFPDACDDIKSAGNCLAVELPTAAIFHLMRVSELGMRRLAKKLRVKLKDRGQLCPYEYAEWNKLITGIDAKLKEARLKPQGPAKQEKLGLYSDAAAHCLYMKDVWRNNVSHTRQPYILSEAMAVFDRVRDFMQLLQRALEK